MTQDKAREAFENWHDALFDESARTAVKNEYGYPQNGHIQIRWQAWQAAIEYAGNANIQKPEFFYNAADWEATYFSAEEVWEYGEFDCSHVVEIGQLVSVPSIFMSQSYNEESDEYETRQFSTHEEAEAWRKLGVAA